jgi:parvulin-like peptidyl-prolyl isomerase
MKRIFKEPLLIFLLLGGAIFALFQQVSNDYQPDNAEIVVTQGHIQALLKGFKKVRQRSPSGDEVDALIQNYVREEVLYREALALGLDQGDSIVRRRLTQKMEFLSEDLASLNQPSEQELQAYLTKHQDDYRQPSRFSFRQIYFNTSKRGESAQSSAMSLLTKLKAQDTGTDAMGDPLMVKHQFNHETEREIQRVLGDTFLKALREIPAGGWQGPIRSGFGLHLVRIDEHAIGKASELNEVREQVVRDWSSKKREQSNEMFYKSLRKRYTVKVENNSAVQNTTSLSMNEATK